MGQFRLPVGEHLFTVMRADLMAVGGTDFQKLVTLKR